MRLRLAPGLRAPASAAGPFSTAWLPGRRIGLGQPGRHGWRVRDPRGGLLRCHRSVSLALAERISRFRYRDLPPDVVAHAKLYLLDTIGAMLAAAAPRYPASRIMMRFVRELGGTRESTLVGQGVRTSCVDAALANGTLAYYCDIEPLHVGAILHALAVVVPTSLAVAEREESNGRRFLASVVLGVEVATRVSYAFDPVALYDRGFHPSAVAGVFGAAAAAGYLFRLSPERQAVALGLAMQQASGLLAWANDPTEHSRPFNPGLAARNGTTAACLARLGLRWPAHAVRGQVRRLHRILGLGESRRARRRLGRALSSARLRLQALFLVRLHASGARRAARPGAGRTSSPPPRSSGSSCAFRRAART